MTGAIFWDLDGTLVDPGPGIKAAFTHALMAMGEPVPDPESLGWIIGPPLIDSFKRLGLADADTALQHYRDIYAAGGLFDASVYPGVSDMLSALAADGHVQCLATAKPHVFAKRITAKFGLDQWLAHQFGPELDGTRNDKGALLIHALNQTGIDQSRSVMIGDRASDFAAAKAANMVSIAVTWGYGNDQEYAQADMVCDAVRTLPALIRQVVR